jgi:hypothetical protein
MISHPLQNETALFVMSPRTIKLRPRPTKNSFATAEDHHSGQTKPC